MRSAYFNPIERLSVRSNQSSVTFQLSFKKTDQSELMFYIDLIRSRMQQITILLFVPKFTDFIFLVVRSRFLSKLGYLIRSILCTSPFGSSSFTYIIYSKVESLSLTIISLIYSIGIVPSSSLIQEVYCQTLFTVQGSISHLAPFSPQLQPWYSYNIQSLETDWFQLLSTRYMIMFKKMKLNKNHFEKLAHIFMA